MNWAKCILGKFVPSGVMSVIAEVGLLLVEGGFAALLLKLDVLPAKYLVPLLILLILVFLGMMILLGSPKKSIRRLIGFIATLVVICVTLLGCSYLYSTSEAFNQVTEKIVRHDEYDVVVLKNSKYKEVSDLDGVTVYKAKSTLKTYKEAQGQLKGKALVEYKTKDDYREIGNLIIEENGTQHDNVALLSKANYSLLCEDIEGFEDNTKILTKFSIAQTDVKDTGTLDVTKDSFNVYISGIDVWGDINKRVSRSDVNMIMTVNPKTRQILLTSIPRDAYVKLHSSGQLDKLTHSGIYGIDETTGTIEDWLGVDLNFYVRANFGMIVKLVNAVDGIKVYSKYDFKSSISEYKYYEGWNKLDGKAALYFARERKSFKDMDQDRIKNQQRVVKAVLKKMMKSKVILTNYTDIMDAIKTNMQTDMSSQEIASLVKMQIGDMKGWKINMNSIRGTMDKKGTYSMGYDRMLDVCIMDDKSINKAVKLINEVMYPEDGKRVKIKDDKSSSGLRKTIDGKIIYNSTNTTNTTNNR